MESVEGPGKHDHAAVALLSQIYSNDIAVRAHGMSPAKRDELNLEAIAAALRAERAKFAAENERLRKVLDRIAYGPFGGPEASTSDLLDSITDFAREALTTKQAAEAAAGGKK
jgi:hypothetical protein